MTPPGRGAVATLAVRGHGAEALVGRRFSPAAGRPLEAFPVGRAVFGRFRTSAAAEEELVVGLISAEEVEINCHGGIAAVEAIREALAEEGCVLVEPEQWARETEADPLAAAALLALAQARTERTAAILLDQYRGALRRELLELQAQLERQEIAAAELKLKEIVGRVELGLHLTQPWKVVLAGRPNAGKSSLMNAIVGYERAIVFPQPGTTRDVLTATTALEGWPVELADTAGMREPVDALEAEGVERARAEVLRADIVLLVADTTAAWDQVFHREQCGRAGRLVVVHNKCDLAPPPADGRPAGFVVSAMRGDGMDALCRGLADALVPDLPPRGAGVPFTSAQEIVLGAVNVLVGQGKVDEAQGELATLLTNTVPGT